jgi:hypothetical protein
MKKSVNMEELKRRFERKIAPQCQAIGKQFESFSKRLDRFEAGSQEFLSHRRAV